MRRPTAARATPPPRTPRPPRGTPEETRARLVEAAAREIEEQSYFGTDTNRIARAAGYAPGTFYKHFPDKRAAFLAAYEAWLAAEWATIGDLVAPAPGRTPRTIAAAVVAFLVDYHVRWRRFRASLRALVALDDDVRAVHRRERRRQIARLQPAQAPHTAKRPAPGGDAGLLLLMVERVCDAIAEGELASLALTEAEARAFLEKHVRKMVRGLARG